jgi:tRNA(Ile2) C34 agmatinyltransferase TiaS
MEGVNMICPVCGSDMQELSPQVWRCKCGHRKIVKTSEQEKNKKEEAKEVYRKRFWDESKRVRKSISHKKEIVDRKKRTSV